MLVVTRKTNEEIVVGGDVRIVIVEIAGDRVKIGIEAPDGITIRRAEPSEKPGTPQA